LINGSNGDRVKYYTRLGMVHFKNGAHKMKTLDNRSFSGFVTIISNFLKCPISGHFQFCSHIFDLHPVASWIVKTLEEQGVQKR
jgi:hypothetical protein